MTSPWIIFSGALKTRKCENKRTCRSIFGPQVLFFEVMAGYGRTGGGHASAFMARYALMKPSMSPSMTALMLPFSKPVR